MDESFESGHVFEKGLKIRTELFGQERVDQSFAPPDELTHKFMGLMTSSCFGQVWGDESISRRDHSLITICLLAAQHRFYHFELHAQLAVRNGCSAELLTQVIQHLYVYCGAPTAVEAYRIVHKILYGEGK
jgi:alkylhydroperoxidase/carboxymuconolactone decarboxylase family protein YurZ